MKGAVFIGLLAYVTLVGAHPFSPYTDNKYGPESMEWSQEAVAAFLKNKVEKGFLQPASVSEYLLTLMQGSRKKPVVIRNDTNTSTSTNKKTGPCVEGGTSNSLQREQLEMILDTIYPITGNPTPFTTLVTPDHGVSMYVDEISPLTTYQVMIDEMGDTSNIWTNYSPCPTCALALLSHYHKSEDEKPTIHVAGVYTESSSLTHVVESLECLGKLVHQGFSIEAWNFDEFKTPEGVPVFLDGCISDINTYYESGNFTSAYMELETVVTFIQQLGQSSHANSWCAV